MTLFFTTYRLDFGFKFNLKLNSYVLIFKGALKKILILASGLAYKFRVKMHYTDNDNQNWSVLYGRAMQALPEIADEKVLKGIKTIKYSSTIVIRLVFRWLSRALFALGEVEHQRVDVTTTNRLNIN